MAQYFAYLFWGLLIVILDISINNFDLFIDGFGYLLIAAGCHGLVSLSEKFIITRILCFVLAILWICSFGVHGELAEVYGIGMTIVNCAMIWQLLGGIGDYARSNHRPDLVDRADNRRIAYVAITAGLAVFPYVMQGSRDAGSTVFVLLFLICTLVLLVMILHLIHRVKVELAM